MIEMASLCFYGGLAVLALGITLWSEYDTMRFYDRENAEGRKRNEQAIREWVSRAIPAGLSRAQEVQLSARTRHSAARAGRSRSNPGHAGSHGDEGKREGETVRAIRQGDFVPYDESQPGRLVLATVGGLVWLAVSAFLMGAVMMMALFDLALR